MWLCHIILCLYSTEKAREVVVVGVVVGAAVVVVDCLLAVVCTSFERDTESQRERERARERERERERERGRERVMRLFNTHCEQRKLSEPTVADEEVALDLVVLLEDGLGRHAGRVIQPLPDLLARGICDRYVHTTIL